MKTETTNPKDSINYYEKSPQWKKIVNYQKNLLCIRNVTDSLLSCMKGHGISFEPEITDKEGNFCEEKLSGFVEKLLTLWVENQREGTLANPSTGENMAESYILKRQELYSCYLYLLMRCSLYKDGYTLVTHREFEERTDFAFLLKQAKTLMREWCVMEYPDGSKKNGLFSGYDNHFGLHLYLYYSDSEENFERVKNQPSRHLDLLTDEGNVKRNRIKSISWGNMEKPMEQADEGDALEDGYDAADGEDDYDDESGYDFEITLGGEGDEGLGYDENQEYEEAYLDYDTAVSLLRAEQEREYLTKIFEHGDEYARRCGRFIELFEQAETDVLRGFCEDLEEIVDLYLIDQGIPPLLDTDKALNVYGSIYDKTLQQAKRYERGIRWKTMR